MPETRRDRARCRNVREVIPCFLLEPTDLSRFMQWFAISLAGMTAAAGVAMGATTAMSAVSTSVHEAMARGNPPARLCSSIVSVGYDEDGKLAAAYE